jgi:monovalent cation:proton antiporter-2 (CPA2) family protein
VTLTAQVALLLAAAVIAVPLFKRLRLGAVLGYLAAGIVIGPSALGLITNVDAILHFAEFGVVLLLFVIGLELQPSRLVAMRRTVFGVGSLQVAVTTALLGLVARAFGLSWGNALLVGFALSESSTALVLQVLAERGELKAHHARAAFGTLLFQDVVAMAVMAALPLIAGEGTGGAGPRGWLVGAGAMVAVLVGGRYLLRPLLRVVAESRVRETFTATALLVVIGTAVVFTAAGLSMALGAFIAGVLLADSEYRHELEADIEPFKGLLLGLFFIATGMSASVGTLLDRPGTVLGLALALLVLKALAGWAVALVAGYRGAAARRFATDVAGGGEFAFVLLALATGSRLLDPELADLLVVVVTLSMIATPLLINAHAWLEERLAPELPPAPFDIPEPTEPRVLIAGFGRFGQIVGRVLRAKGIRFTALEISPAQVDFVRSFGNKLYYGDASRLELLHAAGAEHAEVLVIAVDDVEASIRTAELARRHFPKLKILARARNRQHTFRLMDLGISPVVRELYGSSLEAAHETLLALGVPPAEARASVKTFRAHDERTLAEQSAYKEDQEKMIAAVKESAAQLERLFQSDVPPPG